jgi:SAM-dependent methyltransferase
MGIMKIEELLEKCTADELVEIVLSGKKKKDDGATKIKVRPVKIKGEVVYQAEAYVGKQVVHENLKREKLNQYLINNLRENFKQGQFAFTDGDGQVLCGSKGNMTVKFKANAGVRQQKSLEHNKKKRYILEEGTPVGFLIDLGVMTKDGAIVKSKYDKFKQINRFLEFIEDILPQLSADREQTIIDFGCGKSYLTFAVYYYLHELKGLDIRIIGLDLKKDVIMHCNLLARKYGYDKLKFYVGDIADYKDVDKVDMVVTLHACDTATDYALAKAVKWGAKVILSVPCCQHEANAQIESDELEPVLKYGILKERMSSILTDAIRAGRLEEAGYQTQLLEFIDMEHTPKNILIRATFAGKPSANPRLDTLEKKLNLNLTIDKLLKED